MVGAVGLVDVVVAAGVVGVGVGVTGTSLGGVEEQSAVQA